MSSKDSSDLGDRIASIVQDAVSNMDFQQLNKDITKTVNSAMEGVKKTVAEAKIHGQQYAKPKMHYGSPDNRASQMNQNTQQRQNAQQSQTMAQTKKNTALVPAKPPGEISGSVLRIVGGATALVFGIPTAITMVAGFFTFTTPAIVVGICLAPFSIGGIVAFLKGMGSKRRVNRFKNYMRIIGNRTYCNIKELAIGTQNSENYVIKDLQSMIDKGMFLQGHFDDKKTCFMLSDEIYKQYLDLKKENEKIHTEVYKEKPEATQEKAKESPRNEALERILDEGVDYIKQIHQCNDAIPGEEVSKKLFYLEDILTKIFCHVESHPELIPDLRKFMDYYLPTTIKLVNTYRTLDSQPYQGENIISSKKEIEKTLDTINSAFSNLLDGFFEDTALDVSTDISVLKALLAQEGLTNRDFKK